MPFGPVWKKVGTKVVPTNVQNVEARNIVRNETIQSDDVPPITGEPDQIVWASWSQFKGGVTIAEVMETRNISSAPTLGFFGATPVLQQTAPTPSTGTALSNKTAINEQITVVDNFGLQG